MTLGVARSLDIFFNRSLPVAGTGTRQLNGLYMITLLVLGVVGLNPETRGRADACHVGRRVAGSSGRRVAGLLALACTLYVSRRNDEALRFDLVGRT